MPTPFLKELATSQKLDASLKNPTVVLNFVAGHWGSTEATRLAAFNATPANYPDYPFLWRDTIKVDPQGGDVYFVEVPYVKIEGKLMAGGGAGTQHPEPPGQDDKLSTEFAIDATAGSETAFTSVETIAKKTLDAAAVPDFARSVNVTPDGVKGVERSAPKFEWSLTVHFPFLTHRYCNRMKVMSGRSINNRTFFGRWAGECRFLGMTANWRNADAWAATFKFSDSPTWGHDAWKQQYVPQIKPAALPVIPTGATSSPQRLFNDTLLDLVTDVNGNRIKVGWDYAWMLFRDSTSNGYKVSTGYAAYFERMYFPMDYFWLGIGGAAVPPANDQTPPEDANL